MCMAPPAHAAPQGVVNPSAASRGAAAQAPTNLFTLSGPTTGQAIVPGSAPATSAQRAGLKPAGRVTSLAKPSFSVLSTIGKGARVRLPVAQGQAVEGVVNLVRRENGNLRVAGSLAGASGGSFALSTSGTQVSGLIQLPGAGLAYRVAPSGATGAALREMLLSEVVCANLPRMQNEAPAVRSIGQAAVPILNSRPSAVAQIYLDFDGETVTDPLWNGGKTIVAPSFNLSDATINSIFLRVQEDFWPFNINLTTDVAKYNSAPVGKRMRCIITPNDAAGPGSGGVAYLQSFSKAGTGPFTSNIPCWVFNGGVVGISEAISHEIGHTLSLSHDGRELPTTGHEEYFGGHGSGATTWCPIMGASYSVKVSQWSKGEYQFANNQQDDLAIISGSANGFGYAADEAGNTTATAAKLNVSVGNVNQSGAITQNSDVDFYSFLTTGGTITINAVGAALPNLDISLTLQDSAGNVVVTANPTGNLAANISTTVAPGTYYLKVQDDGEPNVLTSGYTTYGSIGAYNITGVVPQSPKISINDATVTESKSGATATFTVSLDAPTVFNLTVDYATADGTAKVGKDYTATSGTLTFVAGETSKTVTVAALDDLLDESSETFFVNLSKATNATIADSRGVGSILDNDATPSLRVANPPDKFEGSLAAPGSTTFSVTLSAPSGRTVSVSYFTTDGTAKVGNDYSVTNGTMTFAPGQTSQSVSVDFKGDNAEEDDESFYVDFGTPGNATLAVRRGVAIIRNDDGPSVTITTPSYDDTVLALPKIDGTAISTSVQSVQLYLSRLSDGKFWTGSSWGARTALSTTLSALGGTSGMKFERTSGLPSGAKLAVGNYRVEAIAVNAQGFEGNALAEFTVQSASTVTLSSASATASLNMVKLVFTGPLTDWFATDTTRYVVTINGVVTPVERAVYSASNASVLLYVPPTTLRSGDQVQVAFTGLRDSAGRIIISGQTTVFTANR